MYSPQVGRQDSFRDNITQLKALSFSRAFFLSSEIDRIVRTSMVRIPVYSHGCQMERCCFINFNTLERLAALDAEAQYYFRLGGLFATLEENFISLRGITQ